MSGIATATFAASIGGSLLSSSAQKSATRDATAAQERTSQLEIEERRRQFDKLQEVLSPFVDAGTGAVGGMQDLVGLRGPEAEQAAIEQIEASPEFGALIKTGEEGILANASATGGLRGGNTQAALAEFRPQILSQLIDKRYNRLGGLSQLGQASAAGVGSGALSTGAGISESLRNLGEVQAQGALGIGTANANLFGDIGSAFGTLIQSGKVF